MTPNSQGGCRNPLLAKCEDETHTPKVGDLESSGTPECVEFNNRGQNTSDWGVLGVIGKVLKCRCPKCPRIGHLDICSPIYGQKKGRESNWQFESRPLKVKNRHLPDIRIGSATWRWKALESYKFGSDLVLIRLGSREIWAPKVQGLQPGLQPGQFRDNFGTQRILYGGRWWLPLSPSCGESCVSKCPWLVLTPKGFPNAN